jgi:phosphinothricin acetyltransferase
MLSIRKAIKEDVPAIMEIYNEAIVNTTATFDTEPKSLHDRMDWFANRDENFPIFVAQKGGLIVGYAALNKWSERKAYDVTAEISLYILPDFRHSGIGKQLLEVILAEAQHTELVSILARITEGNEHSIYLHNKNGFKLVGVMKSVGVKFDKLLDVTMLQKLL